ncbi:aleurain protease [Trifolium repens]|nr:aleurain protease [Trifolium repens]
MMKIRNILKVSFMGDLRLFSTYLERAQTNLTIDDLPPRVDWLETNILSPVHDQGKSGDCWTHATVEGIEAAYRLAIKTDICLSRQELIDNCYITEVWAIGTGKVATPAQAQDVHADLRKRGSRQRE